ncbi:MAG: alpha/beta hydrolase family protein [Oscillospiraceae bacterium]|jgi:pimeloyl-ACP methyl ester carboxylesterase
MSSDIVLKSTSGYDIACTASVQKGKQNVLIVHGFGSSRNGPAELLLEEKLSGAGMGYIAPDLAGHGSSTAGSESLSVRSCLDDIGAAEKYLIDSGSGRISYFGSGFGAYLLIIYLSETAGKERKAFLRSAAINMFQYLEGLSPESDVAKDGKVHYIFKSSSGKPLVVTEDFVDELDEYNPLGLYRLGCADIMMVHGSSDELAPVEWARRFAAVSSADLRVLEGAGHGLSEDGNPDRTADLAVEFFSD